MSVEGRGDPGCSKAVPRTKSRSYLDTDIVSMTLVLFLYVTRCSKLYVSIDEIDYLVVFGIIYEILMGNSRMRVPGKYRNSCCSFLGGGVAICALFLESIIPNMKLYGFGVIFFSVLITHLSIHLSHGYVQAIFGAYDGVEILLMCAYNLKCPEKVLILWLIHKNLPSLIPKSLSVGECLVCTLIIYTVFEATFLKDIPLGILTLASILCRSLSLGLIVAMIFPGLRRSWLGLISVAVLSVNFASQPVIFMKIISELLIKKRLSIIVRWIGLSFLTMVISVIFFMYSKYWRRSKLTMQIVRKVYHLIIVTALMPVISRNEIELLTLALSGCAFLFIAVEYLRRCDINNQIGTVIETFRNDKDEGPAILSHLWLLIGVAVPIVVSYESKKLMIENSSIMGLLSLGVLDSAAAVFGCLFGGPKWPGSQKTISGTICATIMYYCALVSCYTYESKWNTLVQSVFCAIWEATCDQNDNIFLPLVAFISHNYLL